MATYKVLQDIEAEDKILGPFTLKQFILVIIDICLIVVAFRLAISNWLLVLPFLLPIAILSVLAAPLGRDQPTETWLLAKLRFYLKPNRRIWDQDGVMNLVTITAPKRVEKIYSNNLSQGEVRSRLNALANTLDSRGWAVKNVATNSYSPMDSLLDSSTSDRLIAPGSLPQNVPTLQVDPIDDIMDETRNPLAMHIDNQIKQNTAEYKERVKTTVQQTAADYSFIEQANADHEHAKEIPAEMSGFASGAAIRPQDESNDTNASAGKLEAEEEAFLERLHQNKANENINYYSHLKRLKTTDELAEEAAKRAAEAIVKKTQTTVTRTPDPATLELANNSDDLKVETIAKLANRKLNDGDEVVISLH